MLGPRDLEGVTRRLGGFEEREEGYGEGIEAALISLIVGSGSDGRAGGNPFIDGFPVFGLDVGKFERTVLHCNLNIYY